MTKKARGSKEAERFEQIPNVGPRTADDLGRIGFKKPRELIGQDPYAMYARLCQVTKTVQDPCVIDVFIAAVRFMQGKPAKPWWAYTKERKAHLARGKSGRLPAQAHIDARRRK